MTPFEKQIYEFFQFEPTEQQKSAIFLLSDFIENFDRYSLFLLAGYAGTGKTTILSSLVIALKSFKIPYYLLASTGRAAKVMSRYSGEKATTIHKKIYRRKSAVGGNGRFDINFNKDNGTVYIVDEVSMISDMTEDTPFGSGNLMADFFEYVNSGDNNLVIFVGDNAQLPPVGYSESPALAPSRLKQYVQSVSASLLTEVMRQGHDSNILLAATDIRNNIENSILSFPDFRLGPDLILIDGRELIDYLQTSYSRSSVEQTVVITKSNQRAVRYNQGIRQMVRFLDDEICQSDMLMVVKNNYFLAENDPDAPFDFVANGDTIIVNKVLSCQEQYGLRYAKLAFYFPDYDEYPMESWVILDTLTSSVAQLSKEQSDSLYFQVMEKYKAEGYSGKKLQEKIMEDEFYNALQVKYAYAVTCHKAQGGQWDEVYLDNVLFGNVEIDIPLLRWLYTSITRAKEKLFFVNWPQEYFTSEND